MTKRITVVLSLLAALCVALSAGPARAGAEQGDKTLSPYFFVEGGDPSIDRLPLKDTSVSVQISGVIADVTVRQTYTNEGIRPINARYIFPASTHAAVNGMKMIIGDNVITAKIKEKEAARKDFETAKRQGKSAALLTEHRPNVFGMNVANVMPKDTIKVELHYTELLVPVDGVYEFVYPTVVGPRYQSSQPGQELLGSEGNSWIANPYLTEGKPPASTFHMSVGLGAGLPLKDVICTSHAVDITYQDKRHARVTLSDSEAHGGNRDFILKYRLSGGKIQTGMMLYEKGGEKFFNLMVQPPDRVKPAQILPREYIFVVDVSGSMYGYPLDVSKELLKNLIGNLTAADKFNVVLFSGGSALMSPLSLPATKQNVQRAIGLIDGQQGGGGTELLNALKTALSVPEDENYSRSVIVVTDGYISAEKGVFDLIKKNLGRANFFAFGIGTSVNRYLIEGIAKTGMGEPFVVTSQADAPAAAARFCDYIRSPVMTNIKVSFNGFDAYDVEPQVIPDLFSSRPVMIIGKYHGEPEGTVTVSGLSGSGEYHQSFDVSETAPDEANSPLRYLWARTRIARLSDYGMDDQDPEIQREVTSLGLTYSLLTKYTSFIAVREVVSNTCGPANDVTQPLPLPKGVSNLAVGTPVSKEPEPGLPAVAAMALALIALLRILRRRRESACGRPERGR